MNMLINKNKKNSTNLAKKYWISPVFFMPNIFHVFQTIENYEVVTLFSSASINAKNCVSILT